MIYQRPSVNRDLTRFYDFLSARSSDVWFKFVGLVVLVTGMLVLTGGCSKKNTATAPAPQPDAQVQSAPVADQPPPAHTVSQPSPVVQANGEVDMPELNRSLKRWVLANRRRPSNFEDFAATAGVSIPPPPPGKKYIITKNMHVVLVNR